MCQWHKATVATPWQKKDCPGSSYYSFLNECFDKYFIKFDNGVEGIRQEGQFRCPLEVKRLPPPVPFKASDDTIHCYSLVDSPEQYKNSRPGSYNFCPRATLNHIIANCGAVDLSYKEEDGALLMYDSNDTWMKISDQILSFVSDINYVALIWKLQLKNMLKPFTFGKWRRQLLEKQNQRRMWGRMNLLL